MIDISKIIDAMAKGIILLEYTSLNSGKHKSREVTTCWLYMPDEAKVFAKGWHQNAGDTKMLCYDIEFKKWDDVDRDTIVSWQEIEGDWKVKQARLTDLNWDGN